MILTVALALVITIRVMEELGSLLLSGVVALVIILIISATTPDLEEAISVMTLISLIFFYPRRI